MRLRLDRRLVTEDSTIGDLAIDGDPFACYVLEPALGGSALCPKGAIPAGTYEIRTDYSPKARMRVPELVDVPGRTDIQFHPGNWPRDTQGCLLPGMTAEPDQVTQSRVAFDRLMVKIEAAEAAAERVFLEITDPNPA